MLRVQLNLFPYNAHVTASYDLDYTRCTQR